jgi:hypothetical protein
VLIGQAAHLSTITRHLSDASPGWLVLCAAGELLAYAGYIRCYRSIVALESGPRLPFGVALRVVGLAFGAFSVASAVGGLSVDFWALREAGEPPLTASARIIAMETLRWAILSLAGCVAAVMVLAGVWHRPPWPVPVAWLAVVALCFAGGRWVSTPGRRGRFIGAPGGPIRRALGVAVRALVYLRALMAGGGALRWRALTGGALFWLGDLVCAWAALRAFGLSIAPGPLLLGYMTGSVSTALPLPAGGSGGVDAAMTAGFALAGAPLSAALLGAIAFRVFNFWLPALGATLSFATVGGLRRRLRAIAERRPDASGVSRSPGP